MGSGPAASSSLEAIVGRHACAGSASGPLEFAPAAKPGLWRENLSHEEQTVIEEIMTPTLERMSYGSS